MFSCYCKANGLFPNVQVFPNGKPLALAEFSRFKNLRFKQSKNSRKQDFTQSSHVYMSIRTPVIDEMLAYNL